MKWRWVGLREGSTLTVEMRQSDEERRVNRRKKRRMESGQAGSLKGVGEDGSRGSRH